MSKLRVTMPDGSKWDVDTHYIASHRACYYAAKDTGKTEGPEYEQAYTEEYKYAVNNPDEIIDWAAGNMDWENVAEYAKLAVPAKIDFQEGWINGDKEIVS